MSDLLTLCHSMVDAARYGRVTRFDLQQRLHTQQTARCCAAGTMTLRPPRRDTSESVRNTSGHHHEPKERSTVPTMWTFEVVAPGRLLQTQTPMPSKGDLTEGQVLVKVEAGGICGSDLVYFNEGWPRPAQPGTDPSHRVAGSPLHEIAGTVVATRSADVCVGASVVGWASGFDGLSEYVVTDGTGLIEYDRTLSPTEAIILQPLACVLEAVDRLPSLRDLTVAVIGLGPIGLLFGHITKNGGARRVVGVDRVDRADVATLFGFDEVVWQRSDRWSAAPTVQADIIIEAIGHQTATFRDAVEAASANGTVLYFGVPDEEHYSFPMVEFFRKNLTLVAGVTRDRKAALLRAASYLEAHANLIEDYVTHVLPIDEAEAAFAMADRPSTGQVKIVLQYP